MDRARQRLGPGFSLADNDPHTGNGFGRAERSRSKVTLSVTEFNQPNEIGRNNGTGPAHAERDFFSAPVLERMSPKTGE
jgi:hypothetical protein